MELKPTSCPNCLQVRKSQGFAVVIDPTPQPLCASCAEWKASQDYIASPEYQAWLATIPTGMTTEETIEWTKNNPAPSRTQ
jgi:hypothetical protein